MTDPSACPGTSQPPYFLYLGNKNYSSWSMRAWLAVRQSGCEFEDVAFHLGSVGVRARIAEHSPSGKVPALRHDDLTIWDSLAITEYLAERFPEAGIWPGDEADRSRARSVVAEMHAGFTSLRAAMPFNCRRSSPGVGREPGVVEDIARVTEIWRRCRARAGQGRFLFGAYSAADISFAPVVSRFRTYAVELDEVCARYADAVWKHPHVVEWRDAAEREEWVEPELDR